LKDLKIRDCASAKRGEAIRECVTNHSPQTPQTPTSLTRYASTLGKVEMILVQPKINRKKDLKSEIVTVAWKNQKKQQHFHWSI